MKTHTFEILALAVLVIIALAGGIVLNSQSNQNKAKLPAIQFPAAATNGVQELDLAQQDEVAKTEKYPVMVVVSTGGLDMGQTDEVAKLEAYPLTLPASRGEVDLAQMDEKAKLEAYTPAERMQYQITEDSPFFAIDISKMDPRERERYQITEYYP